MRILVDGVEIVELDAVACALYGWQDGECVSDRAKLGAAWIADVYWNGERPRPECLK